MPTHYLLGLVESIEYPCKRISAGCNATDMPTGESGLIPRNEMTLAWLNRRGHIWLFKVSIDLDSSAWTGGGDRLRGTRQRPYRLISYPLWWDKLSQQSGGGGPINHGH